MRANYPKQRCLALRFGGNRYRRSKYQDIFVENQKEVLVFGIELWKLRSQNCSGWN